MRKKSLLCTLIFIACLSNLAIAAYYDPSQNLTYKLSNEITGGTWRSATEQDIANLFDRTYIYSDNGIGNSYNQEYVDIILGLGGVASDNFTPSSTEGCMSGPLTCEQAIVYCNQNPLALVCENFDAPQGSGVVSLSGFYIENDTHYEGGRQELWFEYRADTLTENWQLDISGPAADLSDYCGDAAGFDGPPCSMPTLQISTVPLPAAAWLFGSALIGLAGFRRKK